MKLCLAIVLAFIAIASAAKLPLSTGKLFDGILPLPEALHDKWHLINRAEDLERIVGGEAVTSGGRKYQILLRRSGSFTCGGSLISGAKVVTAAHCIDGSENNPSLFTVEYDTLKAGSGPRITVLRISKHASYNTQRFDYDVAVLTLSEAFAPGTNADIIELATSDFVPQSGAPCIVSGWGRLTGGGALPTDLMQVTLNAITRDDCQSRFAAGGSTTQITERMVCGFAESKSACNGDSGGPLTCKNSDGKDVLWGVVSWGSSSCSGTPSVFASVPNLNAWLLAQ